MQVNWLKKVSRIWKHTSGNTTTPSVKCVCSQLMTVGFLVSTQAVNFSSSERPTSYCLVAGRRATTPWARTKGRMLHFTSPAAQTPVHRNEQRV